MKQSRSLAFVLLTGLLLTACGGPETGTANTTKPVFRGFTATPGSVTADGNVTLSADVTDDTGVKKVDFYQGTRLVASDDTAPYTATDKVTSAQNGTLEYHAVATDAAGNSAQSSSVNVTVNIPTNTAPTTPAPTATVTIDSSVPKQVTVNVAATSAVGINRVEVYDNGKLVGSDLEAPYAVTLYYTAAQNGSHTVTVKVYDTKGQMTEVTKTVTVDVDDVAPKVSLSAAPATLSLPGTVNFTATASDDRAVTKVEFYDNGVLFATVSKAPYTASRAYTFAERGLHTIRAVAYDAQGNTAESSTTVNVNITDAFEPNDSVSAAASLNIGTPLSGTIAGQARDMDYFKFAAKAGDMLKLTVKSVSVNPQSTLDPYVTILMPDGKTVLEKDDDSGAGLESEIRFNVPQDGTYYAVVTSFAIHDDLSGKLADDKATNTYEIALTRR